MLGRWWSSYDQPRHLHLIPLTNLRAELEVQGCDIVVTDRRTAHTPHDLAAAAALCTNRTRWRRAAAALRVLAAALDHLLAPALSRTRFSNTYRVIARRR